MSKENKRVLFFISTLTDAGAERAMSNITTHLPKGVEADILLNSISERDFPTNARKIDLGMKPVKKMGLGYQLQALFRRIPILYRLKKENHYDACISFMDSSNICNILTGNKYCKTIVSVRVSVEQDQSWEYKYIVRPLVRMFYRRADKIVAVSEGVRSGMIDFFGMEPQKVETITNGYDVKQIQEQMQHTSKELVKNEDDFFFATMGRLCTQKAQWHLIRAFAQIAGECANAKLIIMGQGSERTYLENLVEQYHLENRILFLSHQNNPFAILSQCDVYVMPSMFEGYCNALCEALICGLPCIATDFQTSAREILAPDTPVEYINADEVEYAKYGILTPVCSGTKYQADAPLEEQEKLLARALIELYRNEALRNRYKELATERGAQMDINEKVREWMEVVE